MEGNGQAIKVGLEVDLRGEPTPRTAQRLIFLPPFAPAAETCARTTVLSTHWTADAMAEHSGISVSSVQRIWL
jgi:hypothetical protein